MTTMSGLPVSTVQNGLVNFLQYAVWGLVALFLFLVLMKLLRLIIQKDRRRVKKEVLGPFIDSGRVESEILGVSTYSSDDILGDTKADKRSRRDKDGAQ